MLGLIQEQHPERCRLFMQWQQMDWPVMVDSLDLLGIDVVPLTLAIDEHGTVRHRGLRVDDAETIEADFLDREYPAPPEAPARPAPARAPDAGEADPAAWRAWGDRVATWVRWPGEVGTAPETRGADGWSAAIGAYRRALELDPGDGWSHFRLGTTYRMRYDSEDRQPADFGRAVEHWTRALELDPNNYIWRRRLQQYGPRLDKPYPFYDWVDTARAEIAARGETPFPLHVEPLGSEIAHPRRELVTAEAEEIEPDRRGRIRRDRDHLISIEPVLVPARVAPSESARLHLVFRPDAAQKAHWNNEVDELAVWLEPPEGWKVERRLLTAPNSPEPVSHETRRVEVELEAPAAAPPASPSLRGHALYYVCEDVDGTCLYRRQDIEVKVPIRK